MRRALRFLALTALGVASAALMIGWQLTRAVPAEVGPPPTNLAARAISFSSKSGSIIHGWIVPADNPRGVVLLLPPVRSNRLAMKRRAAWLREVGYASLLIDFQATGESPGDAITFGWRQRFDVLAARQFIIQQFPGLPVAVIGVSLGGAAALLATPPLTVDAMVLEAVYPSIDVAIENRLRMRIGPIAPLLAPLLSLQLRPRLGVSTRDLRPVDHIAAVRSPLLVIGGRDDRHTTEADTQALFAAALEPKELWMIPATAHVDFFDAAGDDYRRRVIRFLNAAVARQSPQSQERATHNR